MVQLSGCRLVRSGAHPKTVNKEADETLYDELTRLQGHSRLSNPRRDSLGAANKSQAGKELANAP
jgi:hypothetical protein